MDENQAPNQDQDKTELTESSTEDVNSPQSYSGDSVPEPVATKKSHKPLLLIIVLILLLAGGVAIYLLTKVDSPTQADYPQTTKDVEQKTEETEAIVSDDTDKSEPVAVLTTEENEYFTLLVPEGFSSFNERIFTYTGPPAKNYSFKNSETNDYFEVNINPAQSGINADFTWNYTYVDGVFTLDKPDTTVCTGEEDEWCEGSGNNGSLDSAIFNKSNQVINGNEYYFTFGNTESETVGNLLYVEQFLEGLEIKQFD